MSFIAEFEIHTPILQEALRAVPDVVMEIEDVQYPPEGLPKLVFWVGCDDLAEFERNLPADRTAEDFEVLARVPDRRLYRVTLSDEGAELLTYPAAVAHDITFLEVRETSGVTRISARVPSREALSEYRLACQERDIEFRLERIYHADVADAMPYGVTDRQHEVLLAALEAGYFEVPRRITLEELAAEFDVSSQALSALLRRGLINLLRHTLARDSDT